MLMQSWYLSIVAQQYAWHWWTLQFVVTYLEEEFVESVVWGNWESRDNRLCGHQTDHERRTYDLRIHIQIVLLVQPILVYMSKVDGKFLFSPVSVNFLTEVVKVFFAICMLLWQVCAFVWTLMCFILLFYEWVHHICSEGWWSEILYVSFPGNLGCSDAWISIPGKSLKPLLCFTFHLGTENLNMM